MHIAIMINFSDPELLSRLYIESASQLIGAIFITFFGVQAYFYQKRRERKSKHRNAVVELEYLSNEYLEEISTNTYLLKGSREILEKEAFTYNQFHQLRMVDDLELRLADIQLINKSFNHKTLMVRLNRSMMAWDRANRRFENAVLTGAVPPDDIKTNRKHLISQLNEIEKFASKCVAETKSLLCHTRIYLRVTKSNFSRLANIITKVGNPIIDEDLMEIESIKLEQEIGSNS